jgi:hypothetical protein
MRRRIIDTWNSGLGERGSFADYETEDRKTGGIQNAGSAHTVFWRATRASRHAVASDLIPHNYLPPNCWKMCIREISWGAVLEAIDAPWPSATKQLNVEEL